MKTGFHFIMHKHTANTMFTDKFNYYTNICQKDLLESPIGLQALILFSLVWWSLKFANTSAACPTESGIHLA